MKRIFYGILASVIFVIGITFTFKNAQEVDLHYYFGIHWHAPLSFMVLTVLTAGIVIGFLFSLAILARMQRQLFRTRRDNRQLEQEVNNLRALPIRDAP